jgi:hypothetical protein
MQVNKYYIMQNEMMKTIDGLIAKTWDDLKEAAHEKNSAALNSLNGRMAELGKMKKDLQTIIARLQEMSATSKPGHGRTESGLRKIRIRVTQGMINQNLLTLTEALKSGIVRTKETFTITTLPNQRRFETFLERVGNKLRARGAIGRFYEAADIQDGDIVELIETESGKWQLRAAKEAEPA